LGLAATFDGFLHKSAPSPGRYTFFPSIFAAVVSAIAAVVSALVSANDRFSLDFKRAFDRLYPDQRHNVEG
jgi:hypothetical protein